MNCWASCLGDCDGGMSREHLFSANLLGDSINVSGGPYGDEPRRIGRSRLVSKILCAKHNSDLSPLDAEAGRFAETLDQAMELHERRSQMHRNGRRGAWKITEYQHDRDLLTRWFLKTTINLANVLPYVVGWPGGRAPIDPPEEFVRTVFHGDPLPTPAKLLAGVKLSELSRPSNEFEFLSHVNTKRELEAGFFGFRSLSFVMWLSDQSPPEVTTGSAESGWDGWNLIGMGGFNFDVGGHLSQRVQYTGSFPE